MKEKIYALGYINNKTCTNIREWFPFYNELFIDSYLSEYFDVEVKEFTDTQYWRAVDIPELNITCRVHINLIIFLNPSKNKAIVFTTFYNTQEFYKHIQPVLDNFDTVVYSGHYNPKLLETEWRLDQSIIRPWLFRPYRWEIPEYSYDPKHPRLYFRGKYISGPRTVIEHLSSSIDAEIDVLGEYSGNYEQESKESFINLSLSGIRDMCNRDIELWSRGIPTIRPRFSCKLAVDIPDNIYIPVDFVGRDTAVGKIPSDPAQLSKDIIETYHRVKEDKEFLMEISNNSRKFYLENFTPDKVASFSLGKLKEHFN